MIIAHALCDCYFTQNTCQEFIRQLDKFQSPLVSYIAKQFVEIKQHRTLWGGICRWNRTLDPSNQGFLFFLSSRDKIIYHSVCSRYHQKTIRILSIIYLVVSIDFFGSIWVYNKKKKKKWESGFEWVRNPRWALTIDLNSQTQALLNESRTKSISTRKGYVTCHPRVGDWKKQSKIKC